MKNNPGIIPNLISHFLSTISTKIGAVKIPTIENDLSEFFLTPPFSLEPCLKNLETRWLIFGLIFITLIIRYFRR